MYENLTAIKSVMSETASIYVHLDWHIGHYVKVLMDEVFGEDNFLNEIIWAYKERESSINYYNRKHDAIYFYSRNSEHIFNYKSIWEEYSETTINKFKYTDETGEKYRLRYKDGRNDPAEEDENTYRQYLKDADGTLPRDWFILPIVNQAANERQDYATQKPEALLERIIKASSNEGMIIADFFGGSGVTAKVSHDLKRKFIHCDVGINSIQTTRDRLIAAGAEFDIYDIQDGVSLFRNPVQTMDKLKSLIIGLKNEDGLDSFWEGAIQDSKLGSVPVYIPNLLDHSTKVLDIPLINRIINEAMPDLPEDTKQVIVYYVDIENKAELKKFISEYNPTRIDIELRDLKSVLDDVVINDEIDYRINEARTGFEIEITSFQSDRLIQKIDAYNQKKFLNGPKISISRHGLELIELISLDCTGKDGIWKSDVELKIDKNGYVILNGKKTKEFWNAKIVSEKKPLRMKIRNIAGDESVIFC